MVGDGVSVGMGVFIETAVPEATMSEPGEVAVSSVDSPDVDVQALKKSIVLINNNLHGQKVKPAHFLLFISEKFF